LSAVLPKLLAFSRLYRRAWACDPADYFEARTKGCVSSPPGRQLIEPDRRPAILAIRVKIPSSLADITLLLSSTPHDNSNRMSPRHRSCASMHYAVTIRLSI
jgi:hypothetical protein